MTIFQMTPHKAAETPTTKMHSGQTEAMGPSDTHAEAQLEALVEWMCGRRTVLVTGMGMSTDTGISDYCGQGNTTIPSVEHDQFVSDPV